MFRRPIHVYSVILIKSDCSMMMIMMTRIQMDAGQLAEPCVRSRSPIYETPWSGVHSMSQACRCSVEY